MADFWRKARVLAPLCTALCACDFDFDFDTPTLADGGWFKSPLSDAGLDALLDQYGLDRNALADGGTLQRTDIDRLLEEGAAEGELPNVSATSPADVELRGAVQKGPFVIGSFISLSLLDEHLMPTGSIFNTQTVNDRGEFDLAFRASGPVALQGEGYYFNEVLGRLSGAELTLRAFYIPTVAATQRVYVNMVTHLTTERIKQLVAEEVVFPTAVRQAEAELLQQLAITAPSYAPRTTGVNMNVTSGDIEDNAYLLGVSSVIIGVAMNRGQALDATLQEVLNAYALDLKDGDLEQEHQDEIQRALAELQVERVQDNLASRLLDLKSTNGVPDMDSVLDQDRDGVVNAADLCPLNANTEQREGDGDGLGDACDSCPNTACEFACQPAATADGEGHCSGPGAASNPCWGAADEFKAGAVSASEPPPCAAL